jgi:DeoR/GlpR family transcriptional regulator of sugar metabolism
LSSTVPPALRRSQMLDRIRREGGVSVAELARDHQVSAITVHRDLAELSDEGLIERVHGGARKVDGNPAERIETDWEKRVRQAGAAKDAIAARAERLVEANATIYIDASSTGLALARALAATPPGPLTVVTNSPAIAFEITSDPLHVIVVPGEVDQHMRLIAGRWAIEFLAGLRMDVAFLSSAGVTLDQGLTTSRRPLADVVNAARENASRSVGLVDSSKFGRHSLLTICNAEELDLLIVDTGLAAQDVERYRRAGVSIEVAEDIVSTT